MKIMRKFSSIPTSFASVCWFSALFAICFFSFLYLHPREKGHFDVFTIDTSEKLTITTTEHVSKDTSMDSLTDPDEELSARARDQLNTTVIELPNRSDQISAAALQQIEENIPPPTAATIPTIMPLEEEKDEDYNRIPFFDVFANPPWNVSREERIAWLRKSLDEFKIIKSTSRTVNFDDKVREFLGQGNNEVCRVNIFMTWIFAASLFGKRELLSLESILRAHSNGCVVILSRTMDTSQGWSILRPLLDRGHKVRVMAPDYHSLLKDTPAQGWLERLEGGEVDPGTVPITLNLSNLLRIAVLFKFGGVYFDTDMIIFKNVTPLRNAIGVQSIDEVAQTWTTVNNAVLIFDKGHPLLWKFLEEFANTFDGFNLDHNGIGLVTRVVTQTMGDTNFQYNLVSPNAFYPLDWGRLSKLFERTDNQDEFTNRWTQDRFYEIRRVSYGVHLWNWNTRNLKIQQKSYVGKFITTHCIICQGVFDS